MTRSRTHFLTEDCSELFLTQLISLLVSPMSFVIIP